jgi:hypothetical protein
MGTVTIRNLDDKVTKRLDDARQNHRRSLAPALALPWNHPIHDCLPASCAPAISPPFAGAEERFRRRLKTHGSPILAVPLTQADTVPGD